MTQHPNPAPDLRTLPHYLAETAEDDRPWLILGKGPSFAHLNEVDTSAYRLLGLNHVAREVDVELAHAIDIDVIEDLGSELLERCRCLVMPWHPHVAFSAGESTLAEWVRRLPALSELARAGRLLTYDLGTWPGPHRSGAPLVEGGFFSGDVVVRLLGRSGVRTLRTLGIDGGTNYADRFRDLAPLTNGQASFDVQMQQIAWTVHDLGLDFASLAPVATRLSVVLVTHNHHPNVSGLLRALDRYTAGPFELVVVDNDSTDGTREFLRERSKAGKLHLIENETNLKCAAATNLALAECNTEFVVYLCASHAMVTQPGWDLRLLAYMERHPEVDLAGDVWSPGFLLSSDRYAPGWSPDQLPRERLLHVQGGAWIARRSLFQEVGDFAAHLHPHGGMDVEFSYRLLSFKRRLGQCNAIVCPPYPRLPRPHPETAVCHPATPEIRRLVEQDLAQRCA